MAGSESAAIEQLAEKEIYHLQARAGNRIKQVMAGIHMEIQGLDQKRKQLERQYAQLEEALELQKFSPLNIGKRDLPERTPSNHLGLCNEIHLHTPEQTPVEMTFNTEAYSDFMGKGLHIDQWPESSIAKPVEVKEPEFLPVFQLGSRDKFYPLTMHGADWFDSLNPSWAKFPENIEGYWRKTPELPDGLADDETILPWPVRFVPRNYDAADFISRLRELEQLDDADHRKYRGLTMHRWTNKTLGNGEYRFEGWVWPDSLVLYLEAGVPPSRAFYHFVMQEHAQRWPQRNTMPTELAVEIFGNLPKYGRSA